MRRSKGGHAGKRILSSNGPSLGPTGAPLKLQQDWNQTMSLYSSSSFSRGRNRILASAAVVALATAGAIGEGALTGTHFARAADVSTPAAQGPQADTLPSFAPLIARVKPAVVSVKVKIVHDGNADSSALGDLPPEVQQFLRRFGGQNGAPANPRFGHHG